MEEPLPWPQILSPRRNSREKTAADSTSPEFEFWMVRNPNFPQPNLLSADQLFSDGFLLPLHLLHLSDDTTPGTEEPFGRDQGPEHELNSNVELPDELLVNATPNLTNSKRWRRIFRKNVKKIQNSPETGCASAGEAKVKEKKREKKHGGAMGAGATSMVSAAELNINIWPFSRSRSAGNAGTRPYSAPPPRKVTSAPCSRSNSAGESKSRKWANSPSRSAGVHLGRSSPVWQVRRTGGVAGGRISDAGMKNNGRKEATEGRRKMNILAPSKAKALSLNVPMCMGYRQNLGCRSEISRGGVTGVSDGGGGVSGEGVHRSNLFSIRNLFTRKVY